MSKSEDLGKYFRIPADIRDLNYEKYFSDGDEDISLVEDYTSHNTERLNVEKVEDLLRSLEFINKEVDSE